MSLTSFKKVVLIGRVGVPGVPETLDALYEYLLSLKREVKVDKSSASMMSIKSLKTVTADKIKADCDLVIVVGGDGSLLNAARIAVPQNLPVLGINRGRLGFLTDIHPTELVKIGKVVNGEYFEEQRFLLTAKIKHQHKTVLADMALNDVVLLPGDIAHMIEFEIYVNSKFVCSQRADGLIIATPTGSTAYALSGGGPIIHPELNAIVLVPMFPHTLSSRPIVVNADHPIEVRIAKSNQASPNISCDGLSRKSIAPGDHLIVAKKTERLRLIHPIDYTYYRTLREKLGWERRATRS
ncbi:MAG: NAD(+) kinase [Gammaproteobacteria bacterium]|nr:NAD(+) kinase [Gammaproteobacteria bacterium]